MDDRLSKSPAVRPQALTAPTDPAPSPKPLAVAAALTEAGRAALTEAAALARHALAPATLRAYRSD